jgi:Tol biopolymer transport system component/predicted Ser/Thr protein kinase
MGEVYRAKDTRLNREVAIKVLPESVAKDPNALARFEREAQSVAALSHPNILGIYDLGKDAGIAYAAMELLRGETLRERLEEGAIPQRKALEYGLQIAHGLAAAHEKGIVHRDLKPENVFVTTDGRVKILDFGLAKVASAPTDLTRSPTVAPTEPGTVMGTVGYMSPEQVRGKTADHRSDIFSLGTILYEMLSGDRAFRGESAAETMAAIAQKDPRELSESAGRFPSSIERILRHCLEKRPEERFDTAHDLAFALETAIGSPSATTQVTPAIAAKRSGLKPALGALAVFAALGAGFFLGGRLRAPTGAARPVGSPQVNQLVRLTHTARSEWPSWSPDGTLLAYASDRSGNFEIFVRRGEGGQDVNVTNDPAQDVQPAFSPDGNTIAFVSTRASRTGLIKIGGTLVRSARTYGGDLWVVPALGGAARRLAADANSPTWRPDGKGILYITGPENRRAIFEVSPGGGPPRAILSSDASSFEIVRIACSPDGRWMSFETQLEGIFLMPASGGNPRALLTGFSHGWDGSSRRLYYVVLDPHGGSRVQLGEIDPDRGTVRGASRTISLMTASLSDLAVSRDGLQVAVAEEAGSRNLTRLPLAAGGGAATGPEEALSTGRVTDAYPSVSPDGRRVAYVSDVLGRPELWILDLPSGRRERLQLPGEDVAQIGPTWMPDGRRLLLSRLFPGNVGANWMVSVDGSGAEEILSRVTREGFNTTLSAGPDGKKVVYPKMVRGVQQVFLYDVSSRQSVQLTDSPGSKFDNVWSPDGRWIALTALQDGVIQLFRMPASGGPMQQLTTGYERMRHPFYSPDGRWIYIQPSHRNIYRVPAEGGRVEQVTRFPDAGLFLEEPTISPDGRYLYYCRGNGGSSLWLLKLQAEGLSGAYPGKAP